MPRATAVLLALATFVACALVPTAARADGAAGTAASLARQMRAAGAGSSALVVDLDAGRRVFSSRPGRRRLPASVEKLYTTSSALLTLGPDTTLDTRVLVTTAPDLAGTVAGDLYLRGAGDPTLAGADLRDLADAVVRAGVTRVRGRVVGDESAFDRRRGTAATGFQASVDLSPLGALMVDRGRTGSARPYYQSNPPAFAAGAFAARLRARGVRVAKGGRAGTTPAGALTLATHRSPTIARLARLANVPSDNYIAETLLKAVGGGGGGRRRGTTARGAATVRATLAARFAIHPSLVDGSGLSRSDRTSPRQVVGLLRGMRAADAWVSFRNSLAVAGKTGTLRSRLRGSPARGRCRAKTGTLHDVSALAGYCSTLGGRTLAFAILMNRVSPYGARTLQDRMLGALVRFSD